MLTKYLSDWWQRIRRHDPICQFGHSRLVVETATGAHFAYVFFRPGKGWTEEEAADAAAEALEELLAIEVVGDIRWTPWGDGWYHLEVPCNVIQ